MWGWERMLIAEAEPLWGQDLCSQDPGQRPTQDGFRRPAVIEGVGALGDTRRLGALREGAGAGAGGARCHAAAASTGPLPRGEAVDGRLRFPPGQGSPAPGLLRTPSPPLTVGAVQGQLRGRGHPGRNHLPVWETPLRGQRGSLDGSPGTGLPGTDTGSAAPNAAWRPAVPWAPPPTVPDTQFRSRPRGTAGVGSTTPVLPRLCPPLDAGSGALPSHCESGGRSLREL